MFLRCLYLICLHDKQANKQKIKDIFDQIFYIYWYEWKCLTLSIKFTKINKATWIKEKMRFSKTTLTNPLFLDGDCLSLLIILWSNHMKDVEKWARRIPVYLLKYICSRVQFQDMFWPLVVVIVFYLNKRFLEVCTAINTGTAILDDDLSIRVTIKLLRPCICGIQRQKSAVLDCKCLVRYCHNPRCQKQEFCIVWAYCQSS